MGKSDDIGECAMVEGRERWRKGACDGRGERTMEKKELEEVMAKGEKTWLKGESDDTRRKSLGPRERKRTMARERKKKMVEGGEQW
jgi:hypothetical protein